MSTAAVEESGRDERCLFVCMLAHISQLTNKLAHYETKNTNKLNPSCTAHSPQSNSGTYFYMSETNFYLFVVWFVLLYADGCLQQCVQFKYPSLSDFKVDDANVNFKCSQQSSFLVSHSNELLLSHNSTHDSDILWYTMCVCACVNIQQLFPSPAHQMRTAFSSLPINMGVKGQRVNMERHVVCM